MIRINLLPYRASRLKENIRKQVSIGVLSFVLLLVILSVYNVHLRAKTNNLTAKLEGVKKEVTIYKAKAQKVEEIKKKLKMLEKQIKIVNQLEAMREAPPKLLEKMTEMVVQDRMQLNRFISDAQTVSVNGIAIDNETIAEFMTRLERSSLFGSVSLKTSKKVGRFGLSMKLFDIKCTKKPKKVDVSATTDKKAAGKKGKKRKK
ncbi:MAG: PilN domain-containing protein [Dissulfuribacterales bacterium]